MRGKVFPQNRINIIVEDHPRLCGEKFVQHLQCYLYTGSPPPMRGKVPSSYVLGKYGRITPAYAGKSAASSYTRLSSWDHPRLCGEKLFEFGNSDFMMGSPPPMRGKVADFFHRAGKLRITPAYAGKSPAIRLLQFLLWDHPRLCGEKTLARHEHTLCDGSPPPMRGKGFFCRQRVSWVGITPAYAGKS